MADKEEAEVAADGGKSKAGIFENKAIVLGIIVIVQALIAIGLTQFVIVPKLGVQGADVAGSAAAKEESAEIPEMGALVGLQEIIVTLAGDSQRPRYLRINVNLEVKDQLTADIVATRLPQLRDVVIMILSDKTAEELSHPEGKKGLRDEIFRRLTEKMPEGILMNVYFSDLVVQ